MSDPCATRPRRLQLLLGALAAGYFGLLAAHPWMLPWGGVNHLGFWFMDLHAILASSDAAALGRNAYAVNPLDYLNRPHIYTHWWLFLGRLGVGRAATFPLGCALAGVSLASAVARLRPRTPGELLWFLLFLCSAPVGLALERGNNDLVIFLLLSPVVPCLLAKRIWLRLLPVGLVALAAGLKYYPAAAVWVLMDADDPRERRLRLGLTAVALAAVGLDVGPDLALIRPHLPPAFGLTSFGSSNLIEWLGWRAGPGRAAGLLCALAAGAGLLAIPSLREWRPGAAGREPWLSFILGAALLTACFFTGTSYGYRWIFALWMAPWLWSAVRDRTAPAAVRRLSAALGALLGWNFWGDPIANFVLLLQRGNWSEAERIARADRFFRGEQPLAWALFLGLAGCLALFGWQCLGPPPPLSENKEKDGAERQCDQAEGHA